jgi:hypothetical protein
MAFALVCLGFVAVTPSVFADVGPNNRLGWIFQPGLVADTQVAGRTVYVGGSFNSVSPAQNYAWRLVQLSTGSGTPTAIYDINRPQNTGHVSAIVDDGSGGWFVGGGFNDVLGSALANLVHILADGTVDDAFPSNANGMVFALERAGDVLYVAGNFTTIGGQPRQRGAAFNIGAKTLRAWNPGVGDNIAFALEVSGSTVFLGGTFTTVGGVTRHGFAAVDNANGALLPLDATGNAGAQVASIVASGNTIYVGGLFTSIGGQPRANVAALDATTAAALPFVADTNSTVRSLLISGSTLYIGGFFTQVGGTARNAVAAVDAASGTLGAWDPNVLGAVFALALNGPTLYMGGQISQVAGQARAGIAAVQAAGTSNLVQPWNPGLSDAVQAMAIASNGEVVAGGTFSHWGAHSRTGLAAFDLVTGDLLPIASPFDSDVRGVHVTDTTVYLAGFFTPSGGQLRNGFAALDRASGALLPWNPDARGSAPSGSAGGRAVAVVGSTAYIAGRFATVGGQPRIGLAAVDAATGALSSWDPGLDDAVLELQRSGNTLVIAGYFTQLVGQPRGRIGAIDLISQTATSFNPNVSGFVPNPTTGNFTAVTGLSIVNGVVYFSGNFLSVGGSPRTHAAAVNLSTNALAGFNPVVGGPALDINVIGSDAYLAGLLVNVNGEADPTLAIVDAATGSINRPGPNLQGQGWHVRRVSGGLLVGGNALGPDFSSLRFFPDDAMGGAPGAPSAPTIYILPINGRSNLFMDWSDSALGGPVTGYIVEVGLRPGRTDFSLNTNEATFSFDGVPAGRYYVRVRAVGSSGVSAASREVAFDAGVAGCAGPPSPPLFTASTSGGNVSLEWYNAVGNASTYQLHVGTSLNSSNIGSFNVGSGTTFSAVAPPGAFYTRMQASNPCGISALTPDVLISVGGVAPPPAPTASATVIANMVNLQWNAAAGAGQYRLDAGSGPGLSNIATVLTPFTSLTANAVPPGTYYVRISAIGAGGVSLASNEVVVIVP